jgi:hypothetical protein
LTEAKASVRNDVFVKSEESESSWPLIPPEQHHTGQRVKHESHGAMHNLQNEEEGIVWTVPERSDKCPGILIPEQRSQVRYKKKASGPIDTRGDKASLGITAAQQFYGKCRRLTFSEVMSSQVSQILYATVHKI